MFKSHVRRSVALAAMLTTIAGVCATGAQASTTTQNFDAGIGSCFEPMNVYGGSAATITAPSVQYTNHYGAAVTVHEWLLVVDPTTGATLDWAWEGGTTVYPSQTATWPEATRNIPSRSGANAFVVARAELAVYYNSNTPFEIWMGIPSGYKKYTNGAFGRVYEGMTSVC